MKRIIGWMVVMSLVGVLAWAQGGPPVQWPESYAKEKQWQNVMDYGAKDDSTSGAATIGAFNLAETAAGAYGTVFIPAGQFLLDTTWTIGTSNVKIVCAEGARLYFPIEAQASHCYNGVVFDSVSNVEWSGGFIVGDADSLALVANVQSRANGMYLKRADGVVISDVEVRGFEYGIRIAGDQNYTGGGQSQHCILEGAKSHHNQRDNIILENCSYNTVRNCQSWEAGYVDYGADNEYLSWDANAGDVGSGIALRQFTYVGTEDTAWYNVIEGNEIWNCRGQGIIIWRQDSLTQDTRHTSITNNIIHDIRYSGINLASAPNSIVDHNTIWDCNRPNNFEGNVYAAATFNNDGIHVELWSHKTTVYANTIFDTKVYDTASPDEAITYAGIQLGDGSPKDDANTESAIEPAPDSCVVINNVFYNTKRYQKSILDSAGGAAYFTHQEIDGYCVGGDLSGAHNDTLYRTDIRLYRDGRDNMAIDTFSFPSTVIYGNKFMASPYMEIGGYPVKGTPTDDYVLTFDATDSTWNAEAAPGAGGGETNTLADTGTFDNTSGFGLVMAKVLQELRIRGLIEGSGVTITLSGDTGLVIASSGGSTDSALVAQYAHAGDSARQAASDSVALALLKSGGKMSGDIDIDYNTITHLESIHFESDLSGDDTMQIIGAPLGSSVPFLIGHGGWGDLIIASPNDAGGRDHQWVFHANRITGPTNGALVADSGFFAEQLKIGDSTIAEMIAESNHDHSGTYVESESDPVWVSERSGYLTEVLLDVFKYFDRSYFDTASDAGGDSITVKYSDDVDTSGTEIRAALNAHDALGSTDSALVAQYAHAGDSARTAAGDSLALALRLSGGTLSAGLTLDDGDGNSPVLTLTDGDDHTLTIAKNDAGSGRIANDEGDIQLMPSGDVDDYVKISSAAGILTIAVQAGDNGDLVISAGGGDISFDDENLSTTGNVDYGGATSLEVPNGANPTTDADGELAFDNDDEALEVYDGSASRLIPTVVTRGFCVTSPESVDDTICILTVPALFAPGGIKILDVELRTGDSTGTYAVQFEEWTGKQNPARAGYIDTLTVDNDSTWTHSTSFSDADVAVDNYLYAIIPATTGQSFITGTISFYIKGND